MAGKRKDSKGRVLRKGEHERIDGRYHYLYLDASGKRCYVYAKDLLSLREMEKEIERDLLDGISNASGKTTLNQLFKMHMELKNDLRQPQGRIITECGITTIKALQNVMGHSDASITMNVYNHSSFERTEKEVQRIDNVINF